MSAATAGRLARRTVLWALPIGFLGGSSAYSDEPGWWKDAGNLAFVVPLSLLFGFLVALDGWLDDRKAAAGTSLSPGRYDRQVRLLKRAAVGLLLGGLALWLVAGDGAFQRVVGYAAALLLAAVVVALVAIWFRNERSREAGGSRRAVRD